MSNLFDTFIASNYLPHPFNQYVQAGEAQQGAYNKLQDQMQQQQDALAAMRGRGVDQPHINQYVADVQQKAMDLYERNKHYTPEMFGEVRSFMRKAATDPKINQWQTALKNEQDFKAIEKHLKENGEEALYTHKHAVETPVYDNQGNMIYNPETTDLGIERKLDWVKNGSEFVNKTITPWLTQNNMQVQTITKKGPDGKDYPMTVIVDSQGKRLMNDDHRVQKALKSAANTWETTSTEGRQWKRFNPDGNSVNYLKSMLTQVNDNQASFKPVGTGYDKWLNSFGSGADNSYKQPSTYFSSAYNHDKLGSPTKGPNVNNPTKSVIKTQYSDLSPKEKAELYAFSRDEYKKYDESFKQYKPGEYEKIVKQIDAENKAKGVKQGESGSTLYPLKLDQMTIGHKDYNDWRRESNNGKNDNPYGTLLQKYLQTKEDASIKSKGLGTTSYVAEESWNEYAKDRTDAIAGNNAVLVSHGKNSLKPLAEVLDGSDIRNYPVEFTGTVGRIPTKDGGTTAVSYYRVFVPKDKLKGTDLEGDATQNVRKGWAQVGSGGKETDSYALTVAVPNKQIASGQAAFQRDLKNNGPDKQTAPLEQYEMSNTYYTNVDDFDEFNFQHVLATQNNQQVQLPNGKSTTLNAGEMLVISPTGKMTVINDKELANKDAAKYFMEHLNK